MIGRTQIAALPWLLLLVLLATSVADALPRGYGLLVVLAPGWLLGVAFLRRAVSATETRRARIAADAAFATVCVLLSPVGGWWVLPAIAAFAALDAIAPGRPSPGPEVPRNLELALGVVAVVVAIGLTVWLANAPFYSWASATIGPDGRVTETRGSTGLAPVIGLVFFVAPAAAVLRGAILDRRTPGAGRGLLGVLAVVLTVLSILAGFSIGMFIAPIAALAILTFLAAPKARTERE